MLLSLLLCFVVLLYCCCFAAPAAAYQKCRFLVIFPFNYIFVYCRSCGLTRTPPWALSDRPSRRPSLSQTRQSYERHRRAGGPYGTAFLCRRSDSYLVQLDIRKEASSDFCRRFAAIALPFICCRQAQAHHVGPTAIQFNLLYSLGHSNLALQSHRTTYVAPAQLGSVTQGAANRCFINIVTECTVS